MFELICYALYRPIQPVTEGTFETLDAAKAEADARIVKSGARLTFNEWADSNGDVYRESRSVSYGFVVREVQS